MENKILISGFSFVKNAIKFGYPLIESINSILPLVDEFVVACGDSDDGTTEVVESINSPKIRVIKSTWDLTQKEGGKIYSIETNKALAECKGEWLFYLQADEVIHEDDYKTIHDAINKARATIKCEAILLEYVHFYGDYKHIGVGRQWYKREIRIIKNIPGLTSWGDAQGFRVKEVSNYRKLNAIQSDARVFHYGWVRPPQKQFIKIHNTMKFYGGKEFELEEKPSEYFEYDSCYEVKRFNGTHPKLMYEKIAADSSWTNRVKIIEKKKPFLVAITDSIEKVTGYRIGEYKNFIEID
jgi:glycosyltransferase involved in cell wall biosynthesis